MGPGAYAWVSGLCLLLTNLFNSDEERWAAQLWGGRHLPRWVFGVLTQIVGQPGEAAALLRAADRARWDAHDGSGGQGAAGDSGAHLPGRKEELRLCLRAAGNVAQLLMFASECSRPVGRPASLPWDRGFVVFCVQCCSLRCEATSSLAAPVCVFYKGLGPAGPDGSTLSYAR